MSECLELAPQRLEVVDLAVEDDPDGAVLVVDRLMPGGVIDDAQRPHADRDRLIQEDALIVRASMPNRAAHAVHERAALVELAQFRRNVRDRGLYETGDAAHTPESPELPECPECPECPE